MSNRLDYYGGPTSGVSSYYRSHYGYGSRFRRGRRDRVVRSYRARDCDYDYDYGYGSTWNW